MAHRGVLMPLSTLVVWVVLMAQTCGARQLLQTDGGSVGPTPQELEAAIQVISTINDPTTPEDIRIIVNLDSPALVALGGQAPNDTSSSSGARRRLLQVPTPTVTQCPISNAPAVCTAPAAATRTLVKSWSPAQALVVGTPQTTALGPIALTQAELPSQVKLSIRMNNIPNNKGVDPTVQNGTDNPLGPLTRQGSNSYLYVYTLPKSYVVAPGTTNIKLLATSTGGGAVNPSVDAVWLDLNPGPPVFNPTSMPNITSNATGVQTTVTFTKPTATFNGASNPVTCNNPASNTYSIGSHPIVCTSSDAATGYSVSLSFWIIVVDTTPPVITGVPTVPTTEATGPATMVTWTNPTASDFSPRSPAVTCAPASGSTFSVGNTTVTCNATDNAGLTSTVTFTVTVVDTTPPTITATDMTVNATGVTTPVAFSPAPTATDLVDGAVNVSCNPASGLDFPLSTTVVQCSATDGSGNTAYRNFTVTVVDTTPPAITVIPTLSPAEATGPATMVTWTNPTATDYSPLSPAVTCAPASGSSFSVGNTTVTCNATDNAGLTSTVTFTVTVVDTTPPTITATDMTVNATGVTTPVTFSPVPTATDLVDGAVNVSCNLASGYDFPLSTTVVQCNASDTSGNTAFKNFTVTVVDTTPPVITGVPTVLPTEATGPATVVTWTNPTATDYSPLSPAVTCTPAPGSNFSVGNTTVTCNATDNAGLTSTVTFMVTVVDTTPPTITATDMTVNATGVTTPVTFSPVPTATDLVDGAVNVSCNLASGYDFPLSTTVVQCNASDISGNTAHQNFTVTVVDTTPPVITGVPTVAPTEATGPATVVTWTNPTATDYSPLSPAVTCTPAPGSTFSVGNTTVTCNATDNAGLTSTVTFTLAVVDTTPPTITATDMTVNATGVTTPVTFSPVPTATDLVDGAVNVSCNLASGYDFPLSTTVVQCNASDTSGNTAFKNFTVTVVDTTPPVITGVPTVPTTEATGQGTAVTWTNPTATDYSPLSPAVTCSPASGSNFSVGNTTVTCNATDNAGLTSTVTFMVTVVDTIAPVISVPNSMVLIEATGAAAANSSGVITGAYLLNLDTLVTATDAGGGVTIVCRKPDNTVVDSTTALTPLGTSLVLTCTATDSAGNSASKSFTVMPVRCGYLGSPNAPFFLDPIKATEASHSVTGSQTLPLKFNLGGNYGMTFASFYYIKVACPSATPTIAAGNSTAQAGKLTYDATTQEYHFNFQVSSIQNLQATCYQLQLYSTLCPDGAPQSVLIKVTKIKRFLA